MKKETKKIIKKETDTEMLARIVLNGFEQVRKEFKQELKATEKRMEQKIREEVSSVRGEVASVREEVASVREEVASIKEEQKIQGRQLVSIERKLGGTLLSLDETVHRNEFDKVVRRVEVLEA